MAIMEGMLLVQPEKSLMGRGAWKSRHVVLASGPYLRTQHDLAPSSTSKNHKSGAPKLGRVKVDQLDSEDLFLVVYKSKGDVECLERRPLSGFKSCEIRNIAYRKQSSLVPTLVLELRTDETAEKMRKRRSSRAGALAASKDPWADALLFRTITEEPYTIFDWQLVLKSRLANTTGLGSGDLESPVSPDSPNYTSMSGSFDLRGSAGPGSSGRPELVMRSKTSILSQASKDRSYVVLSPSPSLRSRRSDLSSRSSSHNPNTAFTASHLQMFHLPTEMPSPGSTTYDIGLIEGSTSAQGRSSTLSSHTRASNSIASAISPSMIASTPPAPRETILDRAFQMRCIPGSERVQDGEEEKMSSIARFEALMKEQDRRRQKRRDAREPSQTSHAIFEAEEDSQADLSLQDREDEEAQPPSEFDVEISTPAQRALAYIAGRYPPSTPPSAPISRLQTSTTPPIPFVTQNSICTLRELRDSSPAPLQGLRPRTNSSQNRDSPKRPKSLMVTDRSLSDLTLTGLREAPLLSTSTSTSTKEKRLSNGSARKLNLQEFAKRLSSTSSLLLPQGGSLNAGSASSPHGSSSEHAPERDASKKTVPDRRNRNSVIMRGERTRRTPERCGWKSNGMVFGSDESAFI